MSDERQRAIAMDLVQGALAAVDPYAAVCRALRLDPAERRLRVGDDLTVDLAQVERIVVVGGGKAALAMARAAESILDPERIAAGLVVVKAGQIAGPLPASVAVAEAAHPVPDRSSVESTRAMVELLERPQLTERDLVLCLLSGGGSSLMTLPVPAVPLEELELLGQQLLAAGAPIGAINAVRKHLSRIKGGQLAALAAPAQVIALILSDVVGNPLSVIASGPTAPDPSTYADALEVLDRFGLRPRAPAAVLRWLEEGAAGQHAETPKPGDPIFGRVHNVIVGSNELAAAAAARRAADLGMQSAVLSTSVEGEAREVAREHAALLRKVVAQGRPLARPACLVLGGETTVTLGEHPGRGGRNQELALAAALELEGLEQVLVVALATDGNDGPTDAGGALADGTTVARGRAAGLDAREHLERHDAYPFFAALGDLLLLGPTGTNVNDLTLLLAF
jgi:glycerate 2-kinase